MGFFFKISILRDVTFQYLMKSHLQIHNVHYCMCVLLNNQSIIYSFIHSFIQSIKCIPKIEYQSIIYSIPSKVLTSSLTFLTVVSNLGVSAFVRNVPIFSSLCLFSVFSFLIQLNSFIAYCYSTYFLFFTWKLLE